MQAPRVPACVAICRRLAVSAALRRRACTAASPRLLPVVGKGRRVLAPGERTRSSTLDTRKGLKSWPSNPVTFDGRAALPELLRRRLDAHDEGSYDAAGTRARSCEYATGSAGSPTGLPRGPLLLDNRFGSGGSFCGRAPAVQQQRPCRPPRVFLADRHGRKGPSAGAWLSSAAELRAAAAARSAHFFAGGSHSDSHSCVSAAPPSADSSPISGLRAVAVGETAVLLTFLLLPY